MVLQFVALYVNVLFMMVWAVLGILVVLVSCSWVRFFFVYLVESFAFLSFSWLHQALGATHRTALNHIKNEEHTLEQDDEHNHIGEDAKSFGFEGMAGNPT